MKSNTANFFLSSSEARVLAHICGDGYLCLYKCKRAKSDLLVHPRKQIYRNIFLVGYCNTEPELLTEFKQDVFSVYGLKTQMQKGNTLTFRSKWAFMRIKSLGGGKSREWFIPVAILDSNKKIICAWIRAFFDDEAYVEVPKKRICVNSVNAKGLRQVQKLLAKVRVVNTTFNGPYKYKDCVSYRLTVLKESVTNYAKEIGFFHPQKICQLNRALQLD